MKKIKGYTLIELMVGLAVSSVVAIGVMKAYVGQSVVIVKHARMTQATEDGREAFTVISRLLKQSMSSTILISQNKSEKKAIIDFMLLPDLPIWPNTTAPYTNRAVRLSWRSQGTDVDKIFISTSDTIVGLSSAAEIPLVGGSAVNNTQIESLYLDDNADGSYSLKLVAKVGVSAANKKSTAPPITASFESRILPRN
jgi:prepilin-type N-terminal cleavage/methylation domain-containing protein